MKYNAFNTDFEVHPFLSTKKHMQPFYGFIVRDKKHHYFLTGSAVGLEEYDTAIRAFAEHIERKSFYYYMLKKNEKKDISFNELKKIADVVSPREFIPFNSSQLSNCLYKCFDIHNTDTLNWVLGRELTEDKEVYIPSSVFMARSKKRLLPPDTTGTAAHTSQDIAIYNALQEVIERNALARSFSKGMSGTIVNLDNINEEDIRVISQELENQHVDMIVVDISTDFGISVFLALLFSKNGTPQLFAAGAGSSTDRLAAIKKSLLEAYHTFSILRTVYRNDVYAPEIYKRISPISKRLAWWIEQQDLLQSIYQELINHKKEKINDTQVVDAVVNVEELLTVMKRKRLQVYAKALKKPDKKNSLYVYKIFVPQLPTLSLSVNYPYLKNIVVNSNTKDSLIKNVLEQKKIILADDFFINHFFP